MVFGIHERFTKEITGAPLETRAGRVCCERHKAVFNCYEVGANLHRKLSSATSLVKDAVWKVNKGWI